MAVGIGARLAGGVPLAAFVTFMLFMLMRGLIWSDEVIFEERREPLNLEITRNTEETEVIARDSRPKKPDEVKTPPPPPRIEAAKAERPREGLASVLGRLPDLQPDEVDQSDIQFVVSDRDIQPLVRMEPIYPRRAAERGVEGSCLMTMDVAPDGTVIASSIHAECTSSLFASAAKRAVERWKYQPKIQGGQAVIRYGVETELLFQLAE